MGSFGLNHNGFGFCAFGMLGEASPCLGSNSNGTMMYQKCGVSSGSKCGLKPELLCEFRSLGSYEVWHDFYTMAPKKP